MSRKKRVDAIDIQILNILQKNGRIASKELANQIGLSEGPTSKRLKNLLKRGIVEKVIATIDQNAFGYNYQVLMLFKLVEGKAPWFISKLYLFKSQCNQSSLCESVLLFLFFVV